MTLTRGSPQHVGNGHASAAREVRLVTLLHQLIDVEVVGASQTLQTVDVHTGLHLTLFARLGAILSLGDLGLGLVAGRDSFDRLSNPILLLTLVRVAVLRVYDRLAARRSAFRVLIFTGHYGLLSGLWLLGTLGCASG
jgi:hypothetical protein